MSNWSRRTLLQRTAYALAAVWDSPLLSNRSSAARAATRSATARPNSDPKQHGDPALRGNPQPAVASATPDTVVPTGPVTPLPLESVRLTPSAFLTAVETNGTYLLRLEADRLLHNFRVSAGLQPHAAAYGGWESESLGGHTLGHYLSACSLIFAQTGESAYRQRVNYIVAELLQCQMAHGDGYVGGLLRTRDDKTEDGKIIFVEIQRGDIRTTPFACNGLWSPLYNLHKLLAGLLDCDEHCHHASALKIASGLGGYLEKVFARLSSDQMQQLLVCDYGGLNESFVQLHERTREAHWLTTARRLYDHKVLDPLAHERDELEGLHSNTQIPKIIGLARLHEVTGEASYGSTAEFFWKTVTRNRTYVIGGNADRENFQSPLSQYITEQTCEGCSTYNMLKLTRHLYRLQPKSAYFDYYERAHLNHILSQHHPGTGMFTYMMPLMSGARREFSTPFDDFWCCVGTGMESHSKHGDSIYWQRGDELLVNLYIPSELTWRDKGATLSLRTDYPFAETVVLEVTALREPSQFSVSLRIPSWSHKSHVTVNGQAADELRHDGYVTVPRLWSTGDKLELTLGMQLHAEPTRDDPNLLALLYGPLVMAADLGPAGEAYDGAAPVFVGPLTADLLKTIGAKLSTGSSTQPENLTLKPFFAQYDRRCAVYLPRWTDQQLQISRAAAMAARARASVLQSRTLDVIEFGDYPSERDHELREGDSEAVLYRGRNGRQARRGASFEFRMRVQGNAPELQVTYWGKQADSRFRIVADGVVVGTETLNGSGPIDFVERKYLLPTAVIQGKESVTIRFEPEPDASAGPVFGCRVLAPREPV